MIEHLVLFHLRPEVDGERVDWMMRETRILLLKIPAALTVRCGRSLTANQSSGFFFSVELENEERLAAFLAHPMYQRFHREVLNPHTVDYTTLSFQRNPGGDPLLC